jgi:hypothetical protein
VTTSRWQSSHMIAVAGIHAQRGATYCHIPAGEAAITQALPRVRRRIEQGSGPIWDGLVLAGSRGPLGKLGCKVRITSRQAAACNTPLAFVRAASRSILSTADVRAGCPLRCIPASGGPVVAMQPLSQGLLAVHRARRRVDPSTVAGRRTALLRDCERETERLQTMKLVEHSIAN